MRRSSLALLVVLACTPAVEADELVPPDEPADPADLLTQPDERAAAPRHPEPDPRFTSCAALLGDALQRCNDLCRDPVAPSWRLQQGGT